MDLLQVEPELGGVAGDLVNEHRARDTSLRRRGGGRGGRGRMRDVVPDDYHLRPDSVFGFRELGGEPEVQAVPGVIFDDQEAASRRGDDAAALGDGVRRDDGLKNRRSVRGCENIAADGARDHSFANVASMRRLVPATSSCDDAHLVLLFKFFQIGSDNCLNAV